MTQVVDTGSWTTRVWRQHYLDAIREQVDRALPMTVDCVLRLDNSKSHQEVLAQCFASLHAIESLSQRLADLDKEDE